MRVLLVQPYTFTVRGLPQPPLALMYLGGYAEQYGHEVKILDRNLETNARKIIHDFAPEVVGISSLTGEMILDGIKISRYVRRQFPGAKIVWGGVHASILPESTLDNDFVDVVVIGEGEETFADLLDALQHNRPLQDVKGIAFKEGSQIIVNERRPFIKDLDALPHLAWHLIKPEKYLKYETLLLTSRGCPHRCSFCYNRKYHFGRWRGMSAPRVKAEIDHALSFHPIRRFRFDDDNFTVNKKRFYEILDFLPKDIPLYFETRVDYVDEYFCQRLSEFKDPFLFIGVESGDEEMLKKLCKDITVSQIYAAYELINKYHLQSSASFIIGIPGETRAQLQKTLAMIDAIKPTRPSCCIYIPFPGALLTEELDQKNQLPRRKTLKDWATDAEVASGFQYSEIPNAELNGIYKRYWRKLIYNFILTGRLKWIFIGFTNLITNYFRLALRIINQDIR